MKYPRYDYHSHNGYSRCVHNPYSIEKSWEQAQKTKIEKLGITNHVHFNSPIQDFLPKMKLEVESIQSSNLLLGVELDVDSPQGKNVLHPDTYKIIDYVVAGPHNQATGFLKMPDIEEEEIDGYFENLREVLTNSLKKVDMQIWVHPFLQEFHEFGDLYWKKYLKPMLNDCLPICANKGIAIEISAAFHRENKVPEFQTHWTTWDAYYPTLKSMLKEIYQTALTYPEIPFSFGSDAHNINEVGDIEIPIQLASELEIPVSRIINIEKRK
jgi:histidinol phosphatase-like PHP family hydrolase